MRDNRGRMDHRGRHDLVDHRSGVDDGCGVDSLGVSGLALVADLHSGAAIVTVSCVLHILDTTVGKGNLDRYRQYSCFIICIFH